MGLRDEWDYGCGRNCGEEGIGRSLYKTYKVCSADKPPGKPYRFSHHLEISLAKKEFSGTGCGAYGIGCCVAQFRVRNIWEQVRAVLLPVRRDLCLTNHFFFAFASLD